jgi:hypothetical protein
MKDVSRVLCYLGESINNSNLIEVLLESGIDIKKEVILPEGEFRTYIERPAEGISLVFTDGATRDTHYNLKGLQGG